MEFLCSHSVQSSNFELSKFEWYCVTLARSRFPWKLEELWMTTRSTSVSREVSLKMIQVLNVLQMCFFSHAQLPLLHCLSSSAICTDQVELVLEAGLMLE
jgi:hypothetical protein